ncbi:MAG: hypothetical protein HY553_15745 [Elusimicrobia bacterium]|nr:hypothetical protein [Elusimicrobiota bacterium]
MRKWGLGLLGLAALAGLLPRDERTEIPDDLRDAIAGRPPHLAPRFPAPLPPSRPAPRLERLAPIGATRSSLPLSREALRMAEWYDSTLAQIESKGGFEALPPATATMLRLRLSVVASWYWRDESGELFAKPRIFDKPQELQAWTLPVEQWLRSL